MFGRIKLEFEDLTNCFLLAQLLLLQAVKVSLSSNLQKQTSDKQITYLRVWILTTEKLTSPLSNFRVELFIKIEGKLYNKSEGHTFRYVECKIILEHRELNDVICSVFLHYVHLDIHSFNELVSICKEHFNKYSFAVPIVYEKIVLEI